MCARRLMSAAEKGIGGGADPQVPGRCRVRQLFALDEIDAERLFRIGVLAGINRLQANRDMRLRNSQVEDDLDRGISKQGVDADGPSGRTPPPWLPPAHD
jgi:hypothetical protein